MIDRQSPLCHSERTRNLVVVPRPIANDEPLTPAAQDDISLDKAPNSPSPITLSLSSLPTPLDVAHAPDGANGVETRRLVVRVEEDVLVRMPEVRFAAEEIFDLERFLWFKSPLRQRQMEPRLMSVEWIKIDDDQHPVRAIRSGLAVGGDVLVVAGVEAQIVVEVQRGMFAADGVDAGDVGDGVPWPVPIPDFVLVLLGVEVLLAARDRGVLAQLVAGVDAVDGRERRR